MFGAKLTERAQAWILTSATLAVGGDFTHLKTRLGIETAETLCVDSPFDYPRQGVLYVPQGLPAPNTPRVHRRRRQRCLAGAGSQRRARVHPVLPACAPLEKARAC